MAIEGDKVGPTQGGGAPEKPEAKTAKAQEKAKPQKKKVAGKAKDVLDEAGAQAAAASQTKPRQLKQLKKLTELPPEMIAQAAAYLPLKDLPAAHGTSREIHGALKDNLEVVIEGKEDSFATKCVRDFILQRSDVPIPKEYPDDFGSRVKSLDLRDINVAITPETLEMLHVCFPNLTSLNFARSAINDACLQKIASCWGQGLKKLDISGCAALTEGGIQQLQRSIPGLVITGRPPVEHPLPDDIAELFRLQEQMNQQELQSQERDRQLWQALQAHPGVFRQLDDLQRRVDDMRIQDEGGRASAGQNPDV